jgi:aspartyl-tRNA(Asn)/glutamyl-tRNA(Gln) amidotransferase subunit A
VKTQNSKIDPIYYQDASTLAEMIRTREVSPVEVMKAHLDRIETLNPTINAIVTIADNALEAAKAAEAAIQRKDELGPLHGVPFTAKDSIDTANVLTQRGSPIFKGRVPDNDATCVARMKKAGGILIAKTNLPEFSYWIESDNLLSGRTNNPWDLTRTPGGSSGGESAAISAGMSPLGLGTDLAISLRGPAAQTGIVSLKATHGSVPMTGIWPRVPRRFWHVGPMARTIRDLALAFSLLSGPDGLDGFTSSAGQFNAGVGRSPFRRLRVGWLVEPGFGPIDPGVAATVEAAAEALKGIGLLVEPVRIPALERDFALDVFNRLHVMEMKPAFKEATAGRRENEIYKMAKTMLSLPDTSMKDFIEAEQAAERLRDGFAGYFQKYDALLTPVLPIPAHKHGVGEFVINGQKVDATYLQGATVPFNITGLPGISMRFGTSKEGLPINVQVVGSWLAESTILHIASLLEIVSPVRNLHPQISAQPSMEAHRSIRTTLAH